MRHGAPIAVGLAVAVSTIVRFAVAGAFDAPWIAPDEATYGMLGVSLWETGTLALRGAAAPFYSFTTPALVGLPLAFDSSEAGVRVAQLLQAAAMSLAAVPTYLWARRLVSARLAVAAAVLVLLVPHLVYSATLMTEPLALLLVTATLYALARMLERPTLAAQGVLMLFLTAAAATRLQALVLVPVIVVAALLDARFGRSAQSLRRLAPLLVGLAMAAAVGIGLSLTGTGSVAGVYSESAGSGGQLFELPRELLWHAAALALGAAVITLLATATLVWMAWRRGEADAATRSFLAVAAAYLLLLLLQVSLFAAGHLEAAAGRYLVTAYPPLLLGLVVWVSRRVPRPRPAAGLFALALVAVLLLAPLDRVAPETSLQDAPGTVATRRLADLVGGGQAVPVLIAVLAAAVFLFFPARRAGWIVPVVAVALASASVVATRDLAALSRKARLDDTGGEPLDWIDRAGAEQVMLLDTGARDAASLARTVFWNPSVIAAARLPEAAGGLPLATSEARIRPDGVVVVAGRPLAGGDVVTADSVVLAGTADAAVPASDAGPGLTLWRSASPLRVVLSRASFAPNGDFSGKARIRVFGCTRGELAITLVGKEGGPVAVVVDGIPLRDIDLMPDQTTRVVVPAPPYADGRRSCVFDLEGDGLVGTTVVEWLPA